MMRLFTSKLTLPKIEGVPINQPIWIGISRMMMNVAKEMMIRHKERMSDFNTILWACWNVRNYFLF